MSLHQGRLFDGGTFVPALDGDRLARLLGRVEALMRDGQWRTLAAIAEACHGTEASVSARLRDLRKARYGGHVVDRRRTGDPACGLFEYRVIPPEWLP